MTDWSRGLPRLCDSAHAHIDFRDLIPGRIVHNTRLRKVKDPLEGAHGIGGIVPVDAVGGDSGDGGVVLGDAV